MSNQLAATGPLVFAAEALALGFSTGTWCAMYCAPVLVPFLGGREKLSHRRNISLISTFLGGRLAAYAALGLALAAAGLLAGEFFDPVFARRLSVWAYIACGATLIAGSARDWKAHACDARKVTITGRLASFLGRDYPVALLAGLSVGLHICPPYWTAAFRSTQAATPAGGALYFLTFYLGTLPFFLPLLGVPFMTRRAPFFRRIARITQALVGAYFLVFAGLYPLAFRR